MPVRAPTRLLGAAVCDLADPTLALPFARDRAAHATALLGALPFVTDDNDRADWHSQFLLLRFCSITRGRWLPRVMPATRNCPSTCRPPRGGALAPLIVPSANRTFWG